MESFFKRPHKLLEVPPALLEILVEAVACGGGAENHPALRQLRRSAYRLRHIVDFHGVHRGICYHASYPVTAVRQQDNVLQRPGVEEVGEYGEGYNPLLAAENNAVSAGVKRSDSRHRRFGNSADTVVDVLHAVYRIDVFQSVLQPLELRQRSKAGVNVRPGAFRRAERRGNVVEVVLSPELGVYQFSRAITSREP